MILDDFYKIESLPESSKKAFFQSIIIPDPLSVKHSTVFIDYLKMFPLYLDDTEYYKLIEKCEYTEKEIKDYDLKLQPLRRVSWDSNLIKVQEIEGRKIKKNIVTYEYDLQKIQDCDKERIKEIINELQKRKNF